MYIDTLVDGHIHTSLCQHAVGTMEEYVLSGINRGLKKMIFLEHLEEDIDYFQRTWLREKDFDYYFTEGQRLKQRYADRIEIGLGVEVGYNPDCSDKIVERLHARKWDRIGISYHFCRLPGHEGHHNMLSRQQENIDTFSAYGIDKLLSRYFDGLIEAVQIIPGQVLCHLDAGFRHCPHVFNNSHRSQIEQLLFLLKRNEIALEVNTSGYTLRNAPFPMPDIINQAVTLGIHLVAGSDAHKPSEAGRHFDRLSEWADTAGDQRKT